MKANFNFEPPVGNPTTGMKSYHYKGKMSDSNLQTVQIWSMGLGETPVPGLGADSVKMGVLGLKLSSCHSSEF